MAARVYSPFKDMEFNTNGIWRRRYEISNQLQDLHIDVILLLETYLKPHERFFIQNYHFYGTDRFLGGEKSHSPSRPMQYVRYVHLTKAKHIYKRQSHPLDRQEVT
jgi:hypothetical protein